MFEIFEALYSVGTLHLACTTKDIKLFFPSLATIHFKKVLLIKDSLFVNRSQQEDSFLLFRCTELSSFSFHPSPHTHRHFSSPFTSN